MSFNRQLVSVLVVLLFVTYASGTQCDPKICDTQKCTDVTEEFCRSNQGFHVKKDISKCRCCASCVVIKDEGQSCEEQENLTINCGRGQVCDDEKKVCVKGAKRVKQETKMKQRKDGQQSQSARKAEPVKQPESPKVYVSEEKEEATVKPDPGEEHRNDPESTRSSASLDKLALKEEAPKEKMAPVEPDSDESDENAKSDQKDGSMFPSENKDGQVKADPGSVKLSPEPESFDATEIPTTIRPDQDEIPTDFSLDHSNEMTTEPQEVKLEGEMDAPQGSMPQNEPTNEKGDTPPEAEPKEEPSLTPENSSEGTGDPGMDKEIPRENPVDDVPPGANAEEDNSRPEYPIGRTNSNDEPPPPQDGEQTDPDSPNKRKKGDLSKEEEDPIPSDSDKMHNKDLEMASTSEAVDPKGPEDMVAHLQEQSDNGDVAISPIVLRVIKDDLQKDEGLDPDEKKHAVDVIEELQSENKRGDGPGEDAKRDGQSEGDAKNNDVGKDGNGVGQQEDGNGGLGPKEDGNGGEGPKEDGMRTDNSIGEKKSGNDLSGDGMKGNGLGEGDMKGVGLGESGMKGDGVNEDGKSEEEKTEDDKISEQIGQVRAKLEMLRQGLKKEKQNGEESERVNELQKMIEAKQKEIHSLNEERKELRKNIQGDEPVRDEKRQSTFSEEIGEERQRLEELNAELKERKENGASHDMLQEIQIEIESKRKVIHSLTEQRNEMLKKNELKAEKIDAGDDHASATISDDQKVDAAEKAAEIGADVVIKEDGEVKSYDVVNGHSDGTMVLVEKEIEDHDSSKSTVLVTGEGEQTVITPHETSKELEAIKDEEKEKKIDTSNEDGKIKEMIGDHAVKVYSSWDAFIEDQSVDRSMVDKIMKKLGDHSKPGHTASNHKLGTIASSKSSSNEIVAVAKPGDKVQVVEENDGSKVVVKEVLKSPGQSPYSEKESGQEFRGQLPRRYRRQWRRPLQRRFPSWMSGEDDYDFGDGDDDYKMGPTRSRPRRNRGRNMQRRRWGRRRVGRRQRWGGGRWNQAADQRRRFSQGRMQHDMINKFPDRDDKTRQELLTRRRRRRETRAQKSKYDPRMDWAYDPEDDLGWWAADPVVRQEQEIELESWAEDDDYEDVVDDLQEDENDGEDYDRIQSRTGRDRPESAALDKRLSKSWKSLGELMTIKTMLQKEGKRDPKIDRMAAEEEALLNTLLRIRSEKNGNPNPTL